MVAVLLQALAVVVAAAEALVQQVPVPVVAAVLAAQV